MTFRIVVVMRKNGKRKYFKIVKATKLTAQFTRFAPFTRKSFIVLSDKAL